MPVSPTPLVSEVKAFRRTKREMTEDLLGQLDRIEASEAYKALKKKRTTRSKSLTQLVVNRLRDEPEETEEPQPLEKAEKKKKRKLKKKTPTPVPVQTASESVQSSDSLQQLVENYDGAEEMRTPEPSLYHKWETRVYPFLEHNCQDCQVIISLTGPPHQDLTLQRIWDWCYPLEVTEATSDLLGMAQTVTEEYDVAACSSMENIFGEELSVDDVVTHSFKAEAVRFQRWYC